MNAKWFDCLLKEECVKDKLAVSNIYLYMCVCLHFEITMQYSSTSINWFISDHNEICILFFLFTYWFFETLFILCNQINVIVFFNLNCLREFVLLSILSRLASWNLRLTTVKLSWRGSLLRKERLDHLDRLDTTIINFFAMIFFFLFLCLLIV